MKLLDLVSPRVARIRSALLLLLGCSAIIGLLLLSRYHVAFGLASMDEIQRRDQHIQQLDLLLRRMVDAETGVRGYLLTGNATYLEPYSESRAMLPDLIAAIDRDLQHAPVEGVAFERLKADIDAKLDWLERNVQAKHPVAYLPEQGQVGVGKRTMDAIRTQIASIRAQREAENRMTADETREGMNFLLRTITILAIGALGMVLWVYLYQQRQSQLRLRLTDMLSSENARLEAKVTDRTRELSDLANYLTTARESERAHIARELHDELGALLTAARMDASWLSRHLGPSGDEGIRNRFKRLLDAIGSGITIKRRVVEDLRPALLQGLGLGEALRALADDMSATIPIALAIPDALPAMAPDQSLALFRIVQEAFTNIRKYAQAKTGRVELSIVDGQVHLVVADDGVGFDTASPKLHRHGLAGMKHRVQMFKGHLELISAPGQGTLIRVEMPLATE